MKEASPPILTEPPFFVLGSGRSGTTLMQTCLDRHSRLAVPPETHYLARAERWGLGEREAPEDFEAFWADLVGWRRFADLGVEADAVRGVLEARSATAFRDVFAAMLRVYGAGQGAARVGEKTPGHHAYLDRLFSWFPDARVVFMRRDPRAVVASHLKAPWVTDQMRPGKPLAPFTRRARLAHLAERAAQWREANGETLALWQDDPRVHVVAYEALVAAPEGVLRGVCAHLGEAFEPSMIEAGGTAPPRTPDQDTPATFEGWRARHRARAAAPVSRASVERWRTALGPFEAALVEAVCGDAMREGGYEAEAPAPVRRRAGLTARTVLAAVRAEDAARLRVRRLIRQRRHGTG